jgi:small nuclear ribonucleoprotein (snRNP)-like protein
MRAWSHLMHHNVVVNLTSGKAFDGIMWERRGPLLVLRKARMLEAGHDAIEVDGEVVIERDKVEFIQLLGGTT